MSPLSNQAIANLQVGQQISPMLKALAPVCASNKLLSFENCRLCNLLDDHRARRSDHANIVRCAIRLLPDDSLSKSRLGRLPKYITCALVIKRYRRS